MNNDDAIKYVVNRFYSSDRTVSTGEGYTTYAKAVEGVARWREIGADKVKVELFEVVSCDCAAQAQFQADVVAYEARRAEAETRNELRRTYDHRGKLDALRHRLATLEEVERATHEVERRSPATLKVWELRLAAQQALAAAEKERAELGDYEHE